MDKTANEVLALTTEAAEKLGMTDKLIETLNELMSPVITGGEKRFFAVLRMTKNA